MYKTTAWRSAIRLESHRPPIPASSPQPLCPIIMRNAANAMAVKHSCLNVPSGLEQPAAFDWARLPGIRSFVTTSLYIRDAASSRDSCPRCKRVKMFSNCGLRTELSGWKFQGEIPDTAWYMSGRIRKGHWVQG
ncbi:hypothetical protein HBH56_123110 [Parastagonospora nodorum]|uniref:Uncharacterized protein n=1 Tax=Phaeosphaeria nodorum (strain SN15 / ATCC MYA-4574 / FGSC 10173) TaxID=321614 RepID=A0A7U2HUE0_PHANO|nr:hypothetical protein HBH56_123110 [Parastagonospora nodorum]QRC91108.1 hypothetical protein JI435_401000 [Parastagonospora nodorum SN15]KAH3935209.1 hypothetical protein HBH54_048650 [Parastagonospora nodorum]KAH3950018.1 hypothetical protein HBH53_080650 [Parastagonospora nodorum]KAH4005458.1 hypothetical protein HBI10_032040 [Parastagonospora nodorum]